MQPSFRPLGLYLVLGCCGLISNLHAAQCTETPVDASGANPRTCPVSPGSVTADGSVSIRSDRVEMSDKNHVQFQGQVTLNNANESIQADIIHYDRQQDTVTANEALFCRGNGDQFTTPVLYYQPGTKKGETGQVDYLLADKGRGSANRISFEASGSLSLDDLSYTTCPQDSKAWYLSISELELDRTNDIGVAHHAVLHVQNIPVFYWPYVDFPLSDRRKSGFLAPNYGTSDNTGARISVPYYINLAPQMDDTITPVYMRQRGWQLQNEFRYMGKGYAGQLDAEALWNDKETGDNRGRANFRHSQRWSSGISAGLRGSWVSDADYLRDFGETLAESSQVHLPQQATLGYGGNRWQSRLTMLDYQTIDETRSSSQPYAFLPRLQLDSHYPEITARLNANINTEWVNFSHPEDIQGQRLLLQPKLSLPFRAPWGHFVPVVGGDHLSYDLGSTPDSARTGGFEERLQISTGFASIDTGLALERIGSSHTIALEPRLFYAWRPYQEQDQLPVFDTREQEATYAQLFSVERFSGGDRLGDINRISVGLQSRLVANASGEELIGLAIGAGRYREARRVNIFPGIDAHPTTDTITELRARLPGNWYAHSRVNWDPYLDAVRQNYNFLQYQPAANVIFNAGYRVIHEGQRQADISFATPVGFGFSVSGRWNYDLEAQTNLESYAGLEYRSCCWALRVYGSRRLGDAGEQIDSTMAQIEFSGLAKLGDQPRSPFKLATFHRFENPESAQQSGEIID